MPVCGKCKTHHPTVNDVKQCFGLPTTPASVRSARGEETAPSSPTKRQGQRRSKGQSRTTRPPGLSARADAASRLQNEKRLRRAERQLRLKRSQKKRIPTTAAHWAEPDSSRPRGSSGRIGIERALGSPEANRATRNRKRSKRQTTSTNTMPFASDQGSHRPRSRPTAVTSNRKCRSCGRPEDNCQC